MATLQRYAPMGVQSPGGIDIVRTFPEASTQSFKTGDLVTLSSGKVAIAKAAGNNLAAADRILGMALEDATGTADTEISVQVFSIQTVLRLPVYHGTAASAVTAVAGNGVAYELRNHTGNIWCVDIGSTTNWKGRQLNVPVTADMPIGTQYGLIDYALDGGALVFPGIGGPTS